MSDGESPEAAPAAIGQGPGSSPDQRADASQRGWLSAADQRTLIITIAGTLVANVGTVVVVGGALAMVHHFNSANVPKQRHADLVSFLVFSILVAALSLGLGIGLWRMRSEFNKLWERILWWIYMGYMVVGFLAVILFWVGVAAGVK
jgi:hypothetical protein